MPTVLNRSRPAALAAIVLLLFTSLACNTIMNLGEKTAAAPAAATAAQDQPADNLLPTTTAGPAAVATQPPLAPEEFQPTEAAAVPDPSQPMVTILTPQTLPLDGLPLLQTTAYTENFNGGGSGFGPEWQLVSEGLPAATEYGQQYGLLERYGRVEAYIGDSSWTNYSFTFGGSLFPASLEQFDVFIRHQDAANTMKMRCAIYEVGVGEFLGCTWYRVVGGQEEVVPGGENRELCGGLCDLLIEADDATYRVLVDGQEKMLFDDATWQAGGAGFVVESQYDPWSVAYVEAYSLPGPASAGYPLFRDDFESSGSPGSDHWDVGEFDSDLASSIESTGDGVLRWELTAKEAVFWKSISDVGHPDTFSYLVKARMVDGPDDASYGIVFHSQEAGAYYYFTIKGRTAFGLYLYEDGRWTTLVEPLDSAVIQPNDWNYLAVIGDGPNYTFLINGSYVLQLQHQRFHGGNIGVAAELYQASDWAIFEFDEVQVMVNTDN